MASTCSRPECRENFEYYSNESSPDWSPVYREFKHCPLCHNFEYGGTSSNCIHCNVWFCAMCSQDYRKDETSKIYNACWTCSQKYQTTTHKVPCRDFLECPICKTNFQFVQCKICRTKLDCTVYSTIFQHDCQSEPYLICSVCLSVYKTTDHVIRSCRNNSDDDCEICQSFDISKIWQTS